MLGGRAGGRGGGCGLASGEGCRAAVVWPICVLSICAGGGGRGGRGGGGGGAGAGRRAGGCLAGGRAGGRAGSVTDGSAPACGRQARGRAGVQYAGRRKLPSQEPERRAPSARGRAGLQRGAARAAGGGGGPAGGRGALRAQLPVAGQADWRGGGPDLQEGGPAGGRAGRGGARLLGQPASRQRLLGLGRPTVWVASRRSQGDRTAKRAGNWLGPAHRWLP